MKWNGEEALEAALSFQRGEQKGFEFFFTHLYYQLHYYAFTILKDKISAEDAVETAFIRIWELRATFDHPLVIKKWLYSTTRNYCLYLLQQHQKRYTTFVDSDNDFPILTVPSNEHALIKSEIYGELYRKVDNLPCACRKIMRLFYLEGKSVKEICQLLSLSTSTVKNQRARGLKLLRKKYHVSSDTIKRKHEAWIKSIYFSSNTSPSAIAKLYGVSSQCVEDIRKGRVGAAIIANL